MYRSEIPTGPKPDAPVQMAAVADARLQIILTVDERAALLECEAIIRQGRAVFVQVGQALSRIRDSRLYRESYSTFEEYCLAEWEISDRFARNLRSAADVVQLLEEKKFAVLPATESQARPLTKLPREEWAPAWGDVIQSAPGGKVTASHVTNVVQRRINRMAGFSTDTEMVIRAESQTSKIQTFDAGTREDRVEAALNKSRAALRELSDAIGTPDGSEAANLLQSIHNVDELQLYLARKKQLLQSRQEQKQTEGANL